MMKIKEEEKKEIKLNTSPITLLEVYEKRNHQRNKGIHLQNDNQVRWSARVVLSLVRSVTMVQSGGSCGGGENE